MEIDNFDTLRWVVPILLFSFAAFGAAAYLTAPGPAVVSFVDYSSVNGSAADELFAEFESASFVVAKDVPAGEALSLVERCHSSGLSCSSKQASNESVRTVFGGRPGDNSTVNSSVAPDILEVFAYDPVRSEYVVDGDVSLRFVTAETNHEFAEEWVSGYARFLADKPLMVFLTGNSSGQSFSSWRDVSLSSGCSDARFFTTGLSEMMFMGIESEYHQQSGLCVVRTTWDIEK